jgi:hypothetical protein
MAFIHDGWCLCKLCMNFKMKNSMIGGSVQGCRTQFWGFLKQVFKTHECNEIRNVVVNILYACVIMHNMIIKDKIMQGGKITLMLLPFPLGVTLKLTNIHVVVKRLKMQMFIIDCTMVSLNICGFKKAIVRCNEDKFCSCLFLLIIRHCFILQHFHIS